MPTYTVHDPYIRDFSHEILFAGENIHTKIVQLKVGVKKIQD
jgi:hypothetical protein